MPTDAEITAFLTDRVLGWVLTPQAEQAADPNLTWRDKEGWPKLTPDLKSWDGFGLLLTAVVTAGWRPEISYETDSLKSWTVYLHADNDPDMYTFEGIDPDLCSALRLAVARAYGMEGL